MILTLAALLTTACAGPVIIASHFTDALAGLAVYTDPEHSVIMNLGWRSSDGKLHIGYKALVEDTVHFGEAAPDDSYHQISWTVDGKKLTYEWGLVRPGVAVGVVRCSDSIEIEPYFSKGWTENGAQKLASNAAAVDASGLKVGFRTSGGTELSESGRSWVVSGKSPLQFSMGVGDLVDPGTASASLARAKAKYLAGRCWAEGDWGNFVSPIQNQLGNTKILGGDTGKLAHIVSRGWCLPDGQVLFCWDSFFNGLLSSLEDPKFSRNTLRAILNSATAEGFVPNYAGKGWGVSGDRSQPPVGAYCVWRVHERDPDHAFLKEAYPKLLRWHRWWFSKAKSGKPTHDGNGDGLLEWGSTTGYLQNANYESGLDDSPMFDYGKMVGRNMDLDSTDLSALYAMDADYLAKIAAAIGKKAESKTLQAESAAMAKRIDRYMWNDRLGAYCYRYWQPIVSVEKVPLRSVCSSQGQPGMQTSLFHGRNLEGVAKQYTDFQIDHEWTASPFVGSDNKDFSLRWTATLTPKVSGPYQFEAVSDDGCRLWIDGKQVINGWSVHAATKYVSPMQNFRAGQAHSFRFEYFQAEGGAQVSLKLHRIAVEKPAEAFLNRLSPLNFYPLIVGSPSKERARRTLDLFFSPKQFGGEWVCPTISKSDPAYPAQGYWRGTVWGPTSYLTYQGLRRYATNGELLYFAERSVKLFMKNWNADGSCHENFNSITGVGRSDPHYTWGALLCLLGLEQLCDTHADGSISLNGATGRNITVHNLRLNGSLYDLYIRPHHAELKRAGRLVAWASGSVARVKLTDRAAHVQ